MQVVEAQNTIGTNVLKINKSRSTCAYQYIPIDVITVAGRHRHVRVAKLRDQLLAKQRGYRVECEQIAQAHHPAALSQ